MSAIAMASAAVAHQVATNASDSSKQHFRFLYEVFLKSALTGKPFISVPHVLGQKIGTAALEDMARRFSDMIQKDVQIVFNPLVAAYLIGPADNLPQTPVSTMYIAEYRPQNMHPAQVRKVPVVKPPKIPKPANSFILYRNWRMVAMKKDNPNLTAKELSISIGEMWRTENEIIKDHFKDLASGLRQNHRAMLAQRIAVTSRNLQNAVPHQYLPRNEQLSSGNPTDEAWAQSLPLLDPTIEANEELIERFLGRT